MDWLNFQHLRYFWTVAREGGVTRASDVLCLSPATVSEQLRTLERAVGEALFLRQGRYLALTETGRLVYRYAEEIFSLGHELDEALRTRPAERQERLTIGASPALPKLIVYQLLEPALLANANLQVTCHEDDSNRLLGRLALHELDLVLTDAHATPAARVKAYHHALGGCGVAWFGRPDVVAAFSAGFPDSLAAAPLLMPTIGTSLRRSLDDSFADLGLQPGRFSEFDDPALTKTFAHAGRGLFPAPVVMATELRDRYGFDCLGIMPGAQERFFAVTVERKLRHPAVVAITQAARQHLFGVPGDKDSGR